MAAPSSQQAAGVGSSSEQPTDRQPAYAGPNKDTDQDLTTDPNRSREIELEEERKLKARHPTIQRPGSDFLQKRLQRGQKYFDSGDYNMAKASPNAKPTSEVTPMPAIDGRLLNKRH